MSQILPEKFTKERTTAKSHLLYAKEDLPVETHYAVLIFSTSSSTGLGYRAFPSEEDLKIWITNWSQGLSFCVINSTPISYTVNIELNKKEI